MIGEWKLVLVTAWEGIKSGLLISLSLTRAFLSERRRVEEWECMKVNNGAADRGRVFTFEVFAPWGAHKVPGRGHFMTARLSFVGTKPQGSLCWKPSNWGVRCVFIQWVQKWRQWVLVLRRFRRTLRVQVGARREKISRDWFISRGIHAEIQSPKGREAPKVNGAKGGTRTRTLKTEQWILSPSCLPFHHSGLRLRNSIP